MKEVTLREIEAIFGVTDALGVHREALVIPLAPRSPGRVRRLPGGKIEIVTDPDFEPFLSGLAERIRHVLDEGSGGA